MQISLHLNACWLNIPKFWSPNPYTLGPKKKVPPRCVSWPFCGTLAPFGLRQGQLGLKTGPKANWLIVMFPFKDTLG